MITLIHVNAVSPEQKPKRGKKAKVNHPQMLDTMIHNYHVTNTKIPSTCIGDAMVRTVLYTYIFYSTSSQVMYTYVISEKMCIFLIF